MKKILVLGIGYVTSHSSFESLCVDINDKCDIKFKRPNNTNKNIINLSHDTCCVCGKQAHYFSIIEYSCNYEIRLCGINDDNEEIKFLSYNDDKCICTQCKKRLKRKRYKRNKAFRKYIINIQSVNNILSQCKSFHDESQILKKIFGCNKISWKNFSIHIRDNFTCQICGKKATHYGYGKNDQHSCNILWLYNKNTIFNIDHIIPKSKHGCNGMHNLQLTCVKCNQKKGNKFPN